MMRGSPVMQALGVLILLVILGYAGSQFIKQEQVVADHLTNEVETIEHAAPGDLATEIEIYFSHPPESYTLRRPGNGWGKNEHILTKKGGAENPAIHELYLLGLTDDTVWLDVTWPQALAKGRYFAMATVTIGDAEPQSYTFHSDAKQLNGTMELKMPADSE